jgi:hypothetical protein
MVFTTSKILEEIGEGFAKKYKSFGDFASSGKLWDDCVAVAANADLMNKIIFCNDVHEIPPALTFFRLRNPDRDLDEFEKRAIGAFWGFIFKFIFGYRNQRSVSTQSSLMGGERNIIKSATYFYDILEKATVLEHE